MKKTNYRLPPDGNFSSEYFERNGLRNESFVHKQNAHPEGDSGIVSSQKCVLAKDRFATVAEIVKYFLSTIFSFIEKILCKEKILALSLKIRSIGLEFRFLVKLS